MIKAKIKPRKRTTALMIETARKAPTLMMNATKLVVRREHRDFREDVQRKVQRPAHPFIFSPNPTKQTNARRWWFKQIALGRIRTDGKRYIRSGSIMRAWKLVPNYNDFDALITMQNNAPGAEWVVGMKQVPSHARSGHPRIDKLAVLSRRRVDAKLRLLWRTVLHPKIS